MKKIKHPTNNNEIYNLHGNQNERNGGNSSNNNNIHDVNGNENERKQPNTPQTTTAFTIEWK